MNKRKVNPEFEIKEFYTISDIQAYTRNAFSPYTISRWLMKSGIALHRVGRSIYIPIDEFRLKMPVLWDSLVSAKIIRKDYED